MKRLLLSAIRFYRRAVSPLFPPRCRYIPTLSLIHISEPTRRS